MTGTDPSMTRTQPAVARASRFATRARKAARQGNAPAKDACPDSPWLAESVVKTEHYRGQVYRKNASGACVASMPSVDEAELFWKPVETWPATSFPALREEPIK